MSHAAPPSAQLSQERPRDRYIPLNKFELIHLLAGHAKLTEDERRQFEQFCRILDSLLHHQFHERLEQLKQAYASFDPDHEVPGRVIKGQQPAAADSVFEQFVTLMQQANYRRLNRTEVEASLDAASDWGLLLHVDLDSFEQLEVFARGDVLDRRTRRRWGTFGRKITVEVPVYRRLVVAVRRRKPEPEAVPRSVPQLPDQAARATVGRGAAASMHPDDAPPRPIYLKMFKNIPHADINMLLPDTRVRMTWLDQGKIILPTVSGLALAVSKIVMKSVVVFTLAGMRGILALLGLIGGTLGYGAKSFFGYLRTKDKYQLNLTRSLYYQNLDNNAGVLFRVLDEAEEQEFAEAALAYFLLWREESLGGLAAEQLDRQAEAFLEAVLDMHVDFDCHDAIEKLKQFRLADSEAGEMLRARPLEQVLCELDRHWDSLF